MTVIMSSFRFQLPTCSYKLIPLEVKLLQYRQFPSSAESLDRVPPKCHRVYKGSLSGLMCPFSAGKDYSSSFLDKTCLCL